VLVAVGAAIVAVGAASVVVDETIVAAGEVPVALGVTVGAGGLHAPMTTATTNAIAKTINLLVILLLDIISNLRT
jgi:hypothetical protein